MISFRSIGQAIRRFLARQGLFVMFLRSYVLIVAILLIFSLLTYFIAIDRISGNVQKFNRSLLDGISATIDRRFVEAERTAYRLSTLGMTNKLAYMDKTNVDYYSEMTDYIRTLWTLWLENDRLTPRMYIYFARSGIVATPNTFYSVEDFYGEFFEYGTMEGDAFFRMLLEGSSNTRYLPAQTVRLGDFETQLGSYEMMAYIYHLRQSAGDTPPGAIFFLIDTHEIGLMMNALELGEGGLAAILDREGRIVAKLDRGSGLGDGEILAIAGGQEPTTGDPMLLSSLSDRNGWRYLALGSRDVFMEPVLALRQVFLVLFLLSLLGGMAMAFSMARKRSLPLFRLASRLNPEGECSPGPEPDRSSGYESLETGVDRVLQSNLSMQERLRDLQPMVLPAFMHQLFNGGFGDDSEIRSAADRLGIGLPPGPYRLISFRIPQARDIAGQPRDRLVPTLMAQDAVRECLRFLAGGNELTYEVNLDETVWICGAPVAPDEGGLLELLERIVDWLGEHRIRVLVRFSPTFGSLAAAWWEWIRLQQVHAGLGDGDDGSRIELAWRDPDPGQAQYMLLLEPILSSIFKSGDERLIGRLLDIVRMEIFGEGRLDVETRRTLVRQLSAFVDRLLDRPPVDRENAGDPGALFESLRGELLEACGEANRSRRESGSFLLRKIRDFTDRQLFNPELSLTLIADRMNISENYLSKIYKEHHGDTLANDIEKRRIEAARTLLLTTMESVSDIARQVGYHSDHVFRRAFRRVTGMSPNEYRQAGGESA